MNGMEMLMKQLGFNPQQIAKDFEKVKQEIIDLLTTNNARLSAIEQKLDRLLSSADPSFVPDNLPTALEVHKNGNGNTGGGSSNW